MNESCKALADIEHLVSMQVPLAAVSDICSGMWAPVRPRKHLKTWT